MATKSLLFTPIKLGRVTAKNRICVSPMCQYSAKDGFITNWHLVHLGARAIGGAGIVMMEATAVEARGRITAGCTGIWRDEHINKLGELTDFLKSHGSVPAIQLAHAGRKASRQPPWLGMDIPLPEDEGWEIIAPSAIPFDEKHNFVPKEATLDDIAQIRAAFVSAAQRSIKAGFELIELHYAHGYLVNSFLSPLSNQRTDQYGGSFENRTRLALEIIRDVREVVGEDFPLFVRLSCAEYIEGGWTLEDSIELAKKLKELGATLIDCSFGFNSSKSKQSFYLNNVDQIHFAEVIQREAGIATGAVGGVVSGRWAEEILQRNKATIILIGRASLDDPHWPMHAAFEIGAAEEFEVPLQYDWSIGHIDGAFGGKWRQTVLPDQNNKQLEAV